MATTAKRWLIGCGIGCLGLIVLVVAAGVGFMMWIQGSGELLEPQTLLGPDTTGHVEWTLTLDDPGTEGFAHALIEAIRAIPPQASEDFPPWMVGWLTQMQRRETERDILELFPLAAAWTVRPGDTPEEDLHLFSVSVQRLGNRLVFGDWIMGWVFPRAEGFAVERYGGERIYQIPVDEERPVSFFLRRGNVFFTSDAETARVAVDRLQAAEADREPTALDRLFAETEAGGPMRGAIDNGRGEVARLWSWISSGSEAVPDPGLWAGLRSLTLSGGLQADGSLSTKLHFACPDARWAEARTPELVAALHDGLDWTGIDLDVRARPVGDRIEVDLQAPELVGHLQRWVREARKIDSNPGDVRIDF
jgi:hypothetical protein